MHRQENHRILDQHGVLRIRLVLADQFRRQPSEAEVIGEVGLPHEIQPVDRIKAAVVRSHAVRPLVIANRVDDGSKEIVQEGECFGVMRVVAESGSAFGVANMSYQLRAKAIHVIDRALVSCFSRRSVGHVAQKRYIV
jgi:hypothetical protein